MDASSSQEGWVCPALPALPGRKMDVPSGEAKVEPPAVSSHQEQQQQQQQHHHRLVPTARSFGMMQLLSVSSFTSLRYGKWDRLRSGSPSAGRSWKGCFVMGAKAIGV
ncbi:hypothetical protein LZ31DRAFT_319744 [Colletotrichum somersetense]|nr:hypothetical protein LZ31DRAFT_319744 [Colletotrichum somersetense]